MGTLKLDQREELALGYQATYKRLQRELEGMLAAGLPAPAELRARLEAEDEHGLLAWCLRYGGSTLTPFSVLRLEHPAVWAAL